MSAPGQERIEARLVELGITLPQRRTPSIAHLVKTARTGDLLFVSGHGPRDQVGEIVHKGKLGAELTTAEGQDAARLCVLGCLSSVRDALGSLDRVRRVVKATGYIASDPGFFEQPQVMNGASDTLIDIFGEHGQHSRVAIGVAVIPHNMAMEVEMILEVD